MANKNGLAHKLYVGELAYDFVGRKKVWYSISAALIGLAIIGLAVFHLNLGIEFRGGTDFQAPTKVTAQTVEHTRSTIQGLNLKDLGELSVTTIGSDKVRVQTRALSVEETTQIRQALAKQLNLDSPDKVAYSSIGASWGKQVTQQGLIALVVFLVAVMALIWLYFREWRMSVAAIVALLHDLVITVGIYALTRFSVTPATLIGVLTILGYSLYDTVVVFDKVKERTAHLSQTRQTYSQAANMAVNQVLVRSVNTTIIGVLPVAALLIAGILFLGTGPLKDLGLALFIGMIIGAYSSIFIATPLLTQMKEASPQMREHRESLLTRTTRKSKRQPAKRDLLAEAEAAVREDRDFDAPEPDGLLDELESVAPGARSRAQSRTADQAGTRKISRASGSSVTISGSAGRPQPRNAPRSARKGKGL